MQIQPSFLNTHPLFAELSKSNIEYVLSKASFFIVQKTRFNSWYNHHHIYFLIDGSIKIAETNTNGQEMLLSLLEAPCIFGNIYLRKSGTTELASVFSNDVTLCCFSKQEFELILNKLPSLTTKFANILHVKYLQIKNKYLSGINQSAETRLHNYLYGWIIRNGKQANGHIIAENYFTHYDLGQFIDCSRQQVNKMLNELKEKGAIYYNRRSITLIPDHDVWLAIRKTNNIKPGNEAMPTTCPQ